MQSNNFGALQRIFLVSLGAIPGCLLRSLISEQLFLNLFCAFILGFLAGFDMTKRYQLIVIIGFCGSCTTFSSWMVHLMELIVEGNFESVFYSLISNLFLGLLALFSAFYFGKKTKRSILH